MNLNAEDTFSVNSELLAELQPIDISAQPLLQHEVTPEVEMLCQINIKQKKYEQLFRQYELQNKKKEVSQRLNKVKAQAHQALKKSKSTKEISPKNKWGHSLFAVRAETNQKQQGKQHQQKAQESNKKIQLKPINQRIAQYKQKQAARSNRQIQNSCCLKQTDNADLQKQKQIIKNNAQNILDQIRRQKQQQQQQKKIIQAKIRALQIKANKKVEISKKKPLQAGGDFDLAVSEYSTFSARANNRKLKKKKRKLQIEDGLAMTKKTNSPKIHTNRQINRNKQAQQLAKTVSVKIKEEQKQVYPTSKGPFYLWNIPISPEDQERLNHQYKEVFFNVDRFNYKSTKTFRQQANEYLAQKNSQQMQQSIVQSKQQAFLNQVQNKKDTLHRQFSQQASQKYLDDVTWNEDELFKPTAVPNFHFYTKNAPY